MWGHAGLWGFCSLVSLLGSVTAAAGGGGRGLLSSNFLTADKIIIGTSQSLSPSVATGGGLNTADYQLGWLPPPPRA